MNKKQIEKEIASLSARRETLTGQLSDLGGYPTDKYEALGTALLDGRDTAPIEKAIADLEIKKAGLTAAIGQAGARLAILRADLEAEEVKERREMINKRFPELHAEFTRGMEEIRAGIARVRKQAGEIDELYRISQRDGLIQYQAITRGLFTGLSSWRSDKSGPARDVEITLQMLDGLALKMETINNPPPQPKSEPEFKEIRVHIEHTVDGDIVYPLDGDKPFKVMGYLGDRDIWLPGDRFVSRDTYEKMKEAAKLNLPAQQ
jgi:hypothetical protein